jgi:hypothetical protein
MEMMSKSSGIGRARADRVGVTVGVHVSARSRAIREMGVAVAVISAVALFLPSIASATFTRPFERQIFRPETSAEHPFTQACSETEAKATGSSCLKPGGVATDSSDHLWVGNLANDSLDEFEAASAGNTPVALGSEFKVGVEPGTVAIESATLGNGDIYVANPERQSGSPIEVYEADGKHLETWRGFKRPDIAITDSLSECMLGECTVYVSEEKGVVKLNSKGVEGTFAASESYIKGGVITGAPVSGCGSSFEAIGIGSFKPLSVAVNAEGDIFVDAYPCSRIFEYQSTGQYVGEIVMENNLEVPLLENRVVQPRRVTVDPVSDNLLVSIEGGPVEGGRIYEFDAQTGKFVSELTVAGEAAIAQPLEMAVDSLGDLYVVDSAQHALDVWGPGAYYPTVTLGGASGRTETSAVLNGTVNPAQHGNIEQEPTLRECYFQYVDEAAYQSALANGEEEGFAHAEKAACEGPAISSEPEEQHAVHAAIAKLVAGTTYRYRLVAVSGGGKGGTGRTRPLAFTVVHKPFVVSSTAENVSSSFADLRARIDPSGAQTRYYFEYGPTAAYGQDAPALPGESLGQGGPTGGAVEGVLQHIAGLTAGTTYHYRVVAVNEAGSETGPDQTFTTLPVEAGSERGYELVTPAQKEGGTDLFAEPLANTEYSNADDIEVAESGDALLFETFSPFGAFPAAGQSRYIFRRESAAGRWSYQSLSDPALGLQALAQPALFEAANIERVALEGNVGSELASEGERGIDLAGAPGGPYTTLHEDPSAHDPIETAEVETVPVGASRDLSHVVLESASNEACGPSEAAAKVTKGNVLCEWDGQYETLEDGKVVPKLTLVNLAPGSESEPASACGASLGDHGVGVGDGGDKRFAVSADGSKVFFLAAPGCERLQLYMRYEGETVEVSAPEEGVTLPASEDYEATYVGAFEDGSRVYFISESELTANDAGIHDPELYEYNTETAKLTRVSAGESGHEAAEVVTVYAVAAEGTAVYFTANGVLASNEGPDGSHASPGGCYHGLSTGPCNLYRYRPATDTTSAKISFVARVNENDVTHTGSGGEFSPNGGDLRAESTRDGRYLLFDTREDLTGYSTVGCIQDSEQCMELYRYDAQAAEEGKPAVVCVSCDPSGAPPVSNAYFERSNDSTSYEPVRAMSDNGQFVFFDSADPLVPGASNGRLNAYEWHDGVISLIGSGSDASPTYFLGYAPNPQAHSEEAREGGNVFIGTHAQLTSQDTGGFGEIYDARVCETESPCFEPPPGETLQCEGSSCQTPAIAPPDPTVTLLEPPASVMSSPGTAIKAKGLTRAQKLQKALKACHRERKRKTRLTCEKRARRTYGTTTKSGRARRSRLTGRKGGRR